MNTSVKISQLCITIVILFHSKLEAQLMLTTGSTRLAVSRGQQTWYHFGPIATFRKACDRHLPIAYVTFILAVCYSSDATGLYILRHYLTK